MVKAVILGKLFFILDESETAFTDKYKLLNEQTSQYIFPLLLLHFSSNCLVRSATLCKTVQSILRIHNGQIIQCYYTQVITQSLLNVVVDTNSEWAVWMRC